MSKRARPRQHKRKVKGKKVVVNKGVKVKVKPYTRKSKVGKKRVKIKSYSRRNRGLGKKVTFKPLGTFYVAHDELGNFRGSKVVVKKKRKPVKKARRKRLGSIKDLDTSYFKGDITYSTWIKKRKDQANLA